MVEKLHGGHTNDVSRDGDEVVRQAGYWTESVHHFLEFLHARGFGFAPRVGSQVDDVERLEYIEGEPGLYPLNEAQRSDEALVEIATALCQLHDLSLEYVPLANAQWRKQGA